VLADGLGALTGEPGRQAMSQSAQVRGGPRNLPSYQDLLNRTDGQPAGSAWGLFGPADELGLVNLIDEAAVLRGRSAVRSGKVHNLELRLDAFRPSLLPMRTPAVHTVLAPSPYERDDKLDNLFLQSSTQIDGLRHIAHWEHGFYNGIPPERIQDSSGPLGIHRWSEHGIITRGILIDLPAWYAHANVEYHPSAPHPISVDDLRSASEWQGVTFEPGDALLLRTGWLSYAVNAAPEVREQWHTRFANPGLEQSEAMAEWLWDSHIALLASDNATVERYPPLRSSPFVSTDEAEHRNRSYLTGMLHRILIPLFGMVLGELWDLDGLASACAADGIWEFMLSAKPLNLEGGVGSPANAMAVR
jgi:kynurenine formamidase